MTFQIPIGGVQRLPDAVKVRMARNACRTLQLRHLLRLSGAASQQYRSRRDNRANESISHLLILLTYTVAGQKVYAKYEGQSARDRVAHGWSANSDSR